jgi:hypothetical protein
VLHAFSRRLVLTHGDALCVADTDSALRHGAIRGPVIPGPAARRTATGRTLDADASAAHQASARGAGRHRWGSRPRLLEASAAALVHGHTASARAVALSPTATRQ